MDCGSPYEPLLMYSDYRVSRNVETFKLSPSSYDAVVFTGGADVDPRMYKRSRSLLVHFDRGRDLEEAKIYHYARKADIPMLGIGRGMQLLNVLTGGTLICDVTGHTEPHMIRVRHHALPFKVNSFHHQICIPHEDTHILAWAMPGVSKHYTADDGTEIKYYGPEIEAIYNQEKRVAGVQWHPEVDIDKKLTIHRIAVNYFRILLDALVKKPREEIDRMYQLNKISINTEANREVVETLFI
jgi:putative glutamine amidotransferase